MSYNIEKILNRICKNNDLSEVGSQGFYYELEYNCDKLNDDEFSMKTVEQFGGEDMGRSMWFILQFRDKKTNEVAFNLKVDGWYDSWADGEYTDHFLVEPKEVKKIEWVPVK